MTAAAASADDPDGTIATSVVAALAPPRARFFDEFVVVLPACFFGVGAAFFGPVPGPAAARRRLPASEGVNTRRTSMTVVVQIKKQRLVLPLPFSSTTKRCTVFFAEP